MVLETVYCAGVREGGIGAGGVGGPQTCWGGACNGSCSGIEKKATI